MLRLVHLLGWLVSCGLGGWLAALLGYAVLAEGFGGRGDDVTVLAVAGGVLGGLAGVLLARSTWRRARLHRPLAIAGGAVAVLCLAAGALLLVAAEAAKQRQPGTFLAGFDLFLFGLLAFVVAAIGIGLVLAGVSGIAARRLADQSAPQARASSSQRA